MSKKHFKRLAEIVRTQVEGAATEDQKMAARSLAHLMADFCAEFNGRFDRGRFLAACGLD